MIFNLIVVACVQSQPLLPTAAFRPNLLASHVQNGAGVPTGVCFDLFVLRDSDKRNALQRSFPLSPPASPGSIARYPQPYMGTVRYGIDSLRRMPAPMPMAFAGYPTPHRVAAPVPTYRYGHGYSHLATDSGPRDDTALAFAERLLYRGVSGTTSREHGSYPDYASLFIQPPRPLPVPSAGAWTTATMSASASSSTASIRTPMPSRCFVV